MKAKSKPTAADNFAITREQALEKPFSDTYHSVMNDMIPRLRRMSLANPVRNVIQ